MGISAIPCFWPLARACNGKQVNVFGSQLAMSEDPTGLEWTGDPTAGRAEQCEARYAADARSVTLSIGHRQPSACRSLPPTRRTGIDQPCQTRGAIVVRRAQWMHNIERRCRWPLPRESPVSEWDDTALRHHGPPYSPFVITPDADLCFPATAPGLCLSAFSCRSRRLAAAVAGAVALGVCGFNVTIPHKEAIMVHLDDVSPAARAIGAVNTVHVRDGQNHWV